MSNSPHSPPPPKPPHQQSVWERRVETALWNSRFLVMLAVVPSLLGSLMLFIVGTLDIFKVVGDDIAEAKGDEMLAPLAEALEKALGQQQAATMWFMQNAMQNPNHLGAGAHHYMHIMGIVTLGWMWLRMAKVAQTALASDTDDKAFYEAKLATARYYMDRFLPDVGALRRKLEAGADSLMALDEAAFSTAA